MPCVNEASSMKTYVEEEEEEGGKEVGLAPATQNNGFLRGGLLQRSPLVRINDSCLTPAEAHRKLGLALITVVWACSGDRYNRNEINSRGGTPTFLSKKSLSPRAT